MAVTLVDILAAHLVDLQAKLVQLHTSQQAEEDRIEAQITDAQRALTLAQTTQGLDAFVKYLKRAGLAGF